MGRRRETAEVGRREEEEGGKERRER